MTFTQTQLKLVTIIQISFMNEILVKDMARTFSSVFLSPFKNFYSGCCVEF